MNRIFLILFLLINYIYCFSQDTTYYDINWIKTNPSNAKYYSIVKKTNRSWQKKDYFLSNKRIQMQGTFSSIDPDVKEGYFEWYFINGQLQNKGSFSHNKKIGEHVWYYDNGNLDLVEHYKDGILEGEYSEYYSKGNLKSKSKFLKGIQEGWTTYYYENSKIQSEGIFKNGERNGIWKYYSEDGKLLGTDTIQTEYNFEKSKLYIKLPNDEWFLAVNESPNHFIFKRHAIIDSNQREIIPAIMIYFEDAKPYKQNLNNYSNDLLKKFTIIENIKTEKFGDKDYPICYKNSILYKFKYKQNNLEHVLYIVHIINSEDVGIQIYLDLTKDISKQYESEFLTTIKSIKESNQ